MPNPPETYSESDYSDDDRTPQTASSKPAPKAGLKSALAAKWHTPENLNATNAPDASISAMSSKNNQQPLERVKKDRSETDTETQKDAEEPVGSSGPKLAIPSARASLPICPQVITPVSKTFRLSEEEAKKRVAHAERIERRLGLS